MLTVGLADAPSLDAKSFPFFCLVLVRRTHLCYALIHDPVSPELTRF